MQLSPLIEYLLALKRPGGGNVCRFGVIQLIVAAFAGNTILTYQATPYFNTYAAIKFWSRFSPAMVPNAFVFVEEHRGQQLGVGTISALIIDEGFTFWPLITDAYPILTRATNTTVLNQYFEVLDFYIMVDNEEDLDKINDIVYRWGDSPLHKVPQDRTNELLEQLNSSVQELNRILIQ